MIDYEYARYELRTKVASRPKTVYTGVRDGNMARSVFPLFFYFFLFLVFVVIHVVANLDFYGVLYAEYSGNSQEVSAVVTDVSYYRDKVYVKARGIDGTAFSFKYGSYSGKPGNIVTVRYLKSNPEFAVAVDGSEQSADLLTLVLSGLPALFILILNIFTIGNYFRFRRLLKSKLYLEVQCTDRSESMTKRNKNNVRTLYASYYELTVRGYPTILFKGIWSAAKPGGIESNQRFVFRIYLTEPDNPDCENYYFLQLPREPGQN